MGIKLLCGQVLMEEQRLRTPCCEVVGAEGDEVNADSIEATALCGDHHLRAHIGCCADEPMLSILHGARHVADRGVRPHAGAAQPRPPRQGLEAGHGGLARLVVHAGGAVGELLWPRLRVVGVRRRLRAGLPRQRSDGRDVVAVPGISEVDGSHAHVGTLTRLVEAAAHGRHGQHAAATGREVVRDLWGRNLVQAGHAADAGFSRCALILQRRARMEDVRARDAECPFQT
mmetsp:Transcript_17334/g.49515  ORF Transcript_17334/g.49515 Transcript_17334/m.49515 type:complete len:230 (-) Transcript_17334:1358-2047(-)